jgi:hypothetical protein
VAEAGLGVAEPLPWPNAKEKKMKGVWPLGCTGGRPRGWFGQPQGPNPLIYLFIFFFFGLWPMGVASSSFFFFFFLFLSF